MRDNIKVHLCNAQVGAAWRRLLDGWALDVGSSTFDKHQISGMALSIIRSLVCPTRMGMIELIDPTTQTKEVRRMIRVLHNAARVSCRYVHRASIQDEAFRIRGFRIISGTALAEAGL